VQPKPGDDKYSIRPASAAELTFFRMYVLLEPNNFSTSFARSRDISSEAISANVQRARPTAYMFVWFISLQKDMSASPVLNEQNTLFQGVRHKRKHFLAFIEQ
jgi:hypothetical protein